MAVYGCIWLFMAVYGCSLLPWLPWLLMSFMPVRGCHGCLWLSRSFWSFMAIHGCSWLPWLFIAAMAALAAHVVHARSWLPWMLCRSCPFVVAMDGPGHPIHPGRPAHFQLFLALRCACRYPLIYLPAWNHTPSYGLGPSAIAGLGPIDLRTIWDHRLSQGWPFSNS